MMSLAFADSGSHMARLLDEMEHLSSALEFYRRGPDELVGLYFGSVAKQEPYHVFGNPEILDVPPWVFPAAKQILEGNEKRRHSWAIKEIKNGRVIPMGKCGKYENGVKKCWKWEGMGKTKDIHPNRWQAKKRSFRFLYG